jgi:Coenzyme PQQ synthesis protein D (PqqD)
MGVRYGMKQLISIEHLIISPAVRETANEDGAVLLDVEQGICFSLNPVGLRIWQMLKQHYSTDQMADFLEKEFHAPRPDLVADICEFLAQLEAKHLIRHSPDPTAEHGWLAKILPWKKSTSV